MIYIRELMIFTHATASRSQNVLCRSKNDVFIKQRENAENRKEMRLIEDWGDHQGETVPDETRGAHRSALTSSYSGDDWGPRTAVKVLFRIWLRFQFAGRRSSNETVAEFSCRAVAKYQENIYIPIYIYIYSCATSWQWQFWVRQDASSEIELCKWPLISRISNRSWSIESIAKVQKPI